MAMPRVFHVWAKHQAKRMAKTSIKDIKQAIDVATLFECRNTRWFRNFMDEINELPSYKSTFIDKEITININYIPCDKYENNR